jgi:hypothetical protein
MDSLKSEHTQIKLVEGASNWLHTCSDYHSILKDGSHDQSEQDVKDLLKKTQLPTDEIPMYTR